MGVVSSKLHPLYSLPGMSLFCFCLFNQEDSRSLITEQKDDLSAFFLKKKKIENSIVTSVF